MKNRIIISIFCAVTATAAVAQSETSDSVRTKELEEVVVEGRSQRTSPTATTYIPSGRQKSTSQNAIDLLRQMAIPQIRINPMDNAVKDNAGVAVSVFINYMLASQEEMEGLRTDDVRRVEYLECPADPRFQGALRAINIIVQEYAYGGYTKISADENVLTGLSSQANLFTKFSYRKLTYDLFVAANNGNNHHDAYDTEGIYSLKDEGGADFVLTRRERATASHFRQNQYPVTFRATYNTEKIQIRNTLGYSHTACPIRDRSGLLTYSPGMAGNYAFSRSNPSRSNSLSYHGTFYFAMPRGFSFNVTPRFSYSHNNNELTYTARSAEAIVRDARENVYYYRVDALINKQFGQRHTLMAGVNGGDNINRLQYSGNAAYSDRFHNGFVVGLVGYQLQTRKISLYADTGIC